MADGSNGMNRRRFLKVLGVTGGGAAALSGCSGDQTDKLIPYLIPPEGQVPGVATWYASTCRECPAGCGVHVRVREGRAVKIEGNPEHPVNRGRLCARGQAALQGLYNPDRVRAPLARATSGALEPITWDDAIARIAERLGSVQGAQVRFVTGRESATFARFLGEWLEALGAADRLAVEPLGYEALRHATRAVFGVAGLPRYDFSAARYVLSFGADFLETWLSPVEQARGFAAAHGYRDGAMGRYVHIEPRMSMTAMSADEWIAPTPGSDGLLALALARVILGDRLAAPPADASRLSGLLARFEPEAVASATGVPVETIGRLAREFAAGPAVAVAGGMGAQHGQAHLTAAGAHILNYITGNVGRTVFFDAADPGVSTYAELVSLVADMRSQRVGVLFVHGANPAHGAPPALGVAEALGQVPFKVSFSRFLDETAAACDLVLPDHDPLEQWNDYEPSPGIHSLQQPVMQPVFDTRQAADVLLAVAQKLGGRPATRFPQPTYKDYLQTAWQQVQRRVGDREPFEAFWTAALQRGGVWERVSPRPVRLAGDLRGLAAVAAPEAPADALTLVAFPSHALFDGRGANRPWLQELPDPVTTIAWSTWVEIHPETARERGIAEGDVVEVRSAAGVIQAPAYLYPGVRRDVVAIPMGQGHTAFGRYAEGRGANVLVLLAGEPASFGGMVMSAAVTLRATGLHERIVKTEGMSRQLGRGIARAVTLADLAHGGGHEEHREGSHAAPVPEYIEKVVEEWQQRQYAETKRGNYAGEHPRWGMAIDLSRCTGCSACITACYAENNIATVGPELVRRGREMTWIRVERYFEGGEQGEPLEARHVPMMCQQCGNAPCEPVCPVFAAYHTPDGLNAQVYNRCVGTRYCSNNCPYKVRYFNWFDYQSAADPTFAWPAPLHWLLNPDVTVRSKGVMEKCTFCVQRIRDRQNQARVAKRQRLADGEVVTACQQTCPSEAIVFGDLNDAASFVSRLATDGRGYHVLSDLNVRPAVTYLQRVRNLAEA